MPQAGVHQLGDCKKLPGNLLDNKCAFAALLQPACRTNALTLAPQVLAAAVAPAAHEEVRVSGRGHGLEWCCILLRRLASICTSENSQPPVPKHKLVLAPSAES